MFIRAVVILQNSIYKIITCNRKVIITSALLPTLLFNATILLMRFRTFGKLRPSLVSNGKFIMLVLSSSGVCSVLSDCFHDSESEELRSSLLEDTVESVLVFGESEIINLLSMRETFQLL